MIYLDVDGVLADFAKWVWSIDPEFDDWSKLGMQAFMKENYTTCFRDSKRDVGFDFLKSIYDTQETKLLTAIGECWDNPSEKEVIINNKVQWLTENGFREEDIIIVEHPDEKLEYAKSGNILFDDRDKTVEAWIKKGGIGFKVYNLKERVRL